MNEQARWGSRETYSKDLKLGETQNWEVQSKFLDSKSRNSDSRKNETMVFSVT